jgi:hypothetical protein
LKSNEKDPIEKALEIAASEAKTSPDTIRDRYFGGSQAAFDKWANQAASLSGPYG